MPVIGVPTLAPAADPQLVVAPFKRLRVYFAPEGGSRIEWDLDPHFLDPTPHTFTLQTAHADTPDALWEAVGAPADDTFYAVDDTKRTWSKTQDVYYRVQLVSPVAAYYSEPSDGLSADEYRTWRLSREMLRRERRRTGRYVGTAGWLLRKRRYGPRCPDCTDAQTGGVTESDCTTCWGEGVVGGYFLGVPCTVDMNQESGREMLDPQTATKAEVIVAGNRFAGLPQPLSKDVFVEKNSGQRWFCEEIVVGAQLRSYPFISLVTLRRAPFSDIVYRVPVE